MTSLNAWHLVSGRLRLAPVGYWDLRDLVALKGDPRAFAQMLGGVRSPVVVAEELAADIQFWGAHGYGMWSVRALRGRFLGTVGLMERADGLGVALRFAIWPDARGHGLASEAAGMALRYGHEVAGLARIIAVAAQTNLASRQVLGAIGMTPCGAFPRDGNLMLVYQSKRDPSAA
jgi:RimJ/RimL family protein N-acetyltransferase